MSNNFKTDNLKALLFLSLFIISLVYGVVLIKNRDKVTGNILDMVPATEQNPALQLANDTFVKKMGKKIVLIFSSKERQIAIKAADFAAKKMSAETSSFNDVMCRFDKKFAADYYKIFFPHRWSVLSGDDFTAVKSGDVNYFCNRATQKLYDPLMALPGEMIKNDPFFLFMSKAESMPALRGNFSPDDEHLIYAKEGITYVLVTATVGDDIFGMAQNRVVDKINTIINRTKARFKQTDILWTGMIKYAAMAQNSAQNEVSTVGAGSVIGIILLFIISFRSLKQLFVALVPVFMGLVFAWAATGFVFDKVHVITLVFGSSVIGVSIDYSFHYFSHGVFENYKQSRQIIKSVFWGITLGLLTSLAGYLSMSVTPFPGLRQMSLFASVGLLGAWGTVVFLFPFLKVKKDKSVKPLLWRVAQYYTNRAGRKLFYISVFLLIVTLPGLFMLRANDDIRQLRAKSPALRQEEEQILQLTGAVDRSRFILVTANSSSGLAENEEKTVSLLKTLKKERALNDYISLSQVVPSHKKQNKSRLFAKKLLHSSCAQKYFSILGFNDADIKSLNKSIDISPLSFDKIANRPSVKAYSLMMTGKAANMYSSVIMLDGINNPEKIKNSINGLKFASYVDRVKEISDLFGRYRKVLTVTAVLSYFAILLFLIVRYGLKQGIKIMIPPVTAAVTLLGIMGYAGLTSNIFTFLSLMLVLAIGIDYTLFFAESKKNYRPVAFAVLLSAITTVLSFGLLAVSSTPAISNIGFVMFIGIIIVALLSPVANRELK